MSSRKQSTYFDLWSWRKFWFVLFITCSFSDDNHYERSLSNDTETVLAEVRKIQTAFDPSQNLSTKRIIVCKMAGGLGNRMQGIVSCVALGLALRRAVFIDWQTETRLEAGSSNGLMPCGAEDLFQKTQEWNWNTESAIGMHSAEEQRTATVEAFRSQLVMSSGQKLDWASLLLCRNLTYLLKRTPVLVVPCWRWMPEILQNAAFQPIFKGLFRGVQNGVIPFFSTVVGALFRPIAKVQAAMNAVLSYVPAGAHVIGLHVRLGLSTDNAEEREHFFSPRQVASAWVSCAYASIPHSWRRNTATAPHFWFLATDDQAGAIPACEELRSSRGEADACRPVLLTQAAPSSRASVACMRPWLPHPLPHPRPHGFLIRFLIRVGLGFPSAVLF
jgi:sulfite exporter TauE/SafE